MRDAEQAVDKVLTRLREADAPHGMEGRILRAMEERATMRLSRGAWHGWSGTPGRAGFIGSGVVVAGVLLVALTVTMRKAAHAGSDGRGAGVSAASESLADREAGEVNGVPQRLKPEVQGGGYGTAEAVPLSKASRSASEAATERLNGASSGTISGTTNGETSGGVGVPRSQEANGTEGILDYEALAVSEMLAPSKPAPPLPLTHQEKLLARVVHRGEPEALAWLRSDLRARQLEIAKAEFQEFFEPQPMKDNE